jgi:hypothetical protein
VKIVECDVNATRRFHLTERLALIGLGLLLFACGCHRESDAARQGRLTGTWRYSRSEGTRNAVFSDLTFTVTASGNYTSRVTVPQAHSLKGTAEIKNGILIITATKRDNSNVDPPFVDRQTIIEFDEKELVTRSEGSNVKNHFRNLQSIVSDGEDRQRID